MASGCEVKKSVASKLLDTLASVATAEVKKTGVFTVPGLARLKIRTKPATKAVSKKVFGKVIEVEAKPARKIVLIKPIASLKKNLDEAAPSTGEGAEAPFPVEGVSFIDVQDSIVDAGFSADWDATIWDVHALWNYKK